MANALVQVVDETTTVVTYGADLVRSMLAEVTASAAAANTDAAAAHTDRLAADTDAASASEDAGTALAAKLAAETARDGATSAEAGTLAALAGTSLASATLNAADLTILAALDTSLALPAWLSEDGRDGMFAVRNAADHTAEIAADPLMGLFVPSTFDTSKVWVRQTGINTWLNAQWFGALGVGSDDSAAIQAAIDFAAQTGGPKVIYFPTPASGLFYGCDSPLDLSAVDGVRLLGDGGRVEPTQDRIPSALVYTGTAAVFIKAGKSRGLTIDGLATQYSSASFTGDIISLDHPDGTGGRVTYSTSIVNCMLGGRTSAAKNARSCINATGAVEAFINLNTFGYADQHIIGRAPDGILTFSNAVTITRNRFEEHNVYSINIYGVTEWAIERNTFEYSFGTSGTGGHAAGITDNLIGSGGVSRGSDSVKIENNGFWDCVTGTWIDIYASGQTVAGNFAGVGAGATFLKLNGGFGIKLSANRIAGTAGSTFVTNSGAQVTGFCDDGSNVVDGAVTYNGNPAGFATPDRSFKDVTTKSLTALGDITNGGGLFHARKLVGTDAIGGAILLDRNDDVNWRGGAVFSIYDSAVAKECIAFAVSDSTTTPLDTSKIRAKLTEDGDLYLNGNIVAKPAASATPASNGQMTFELTSNTTLKIKVKGSDGTVRSTSLTLA
jgi:hypothetical protein